MKKLVIAVVLLSAISLVKVNAQDYKTAFGVRGGFYNGLTFKQFLSGSDAMEIVLAAHYRGFMLAGMYQKHTQAFDVPGLNWYFGGGAHLGFYDRSYSPWFTGQSGNFSVLGVMGVVGLEYKIDEIPVTVGIDLTPALNLIGHTGFWFNSGVTLRYVLN